MTRTTKVYHSNKHNLTITSFAFPGRMCVTINEDGDEIQFSLPMDEVVELIRIMLSYK